MDIDDAWNSYIRSYKEGSIKKASIDEKLDVMTSQLNELQTDVSRLTGIIPEMQGDAAALDAASAMGGGPDAGMMGGAPMPPMGGEGPMPGGEGMPMPGEGEELPPEEGEGMEDVPVGEAGEAPPPGEGLPLGVPPDGEPVDEEEEMDEGPDDLDSYLSSFADEEEAEEMAPGGAGGMDEVAEILKKLIAEEDDPEKLADLAKALMLAMGRSDADEEMGDMEGLLAGDEGADLAPYIKSAAAEADPIDTPTEASSVANKQVDKDLEESPSDDASGGPTTNGPITKSVFPMGEDLEADITPEELTRKLAEALMPVLAEMMGIAPGPEDTEIGEVLDESPVDNAPIEGIPEGEGPVDDVVELEAEVVPGSMEGGGVSEALGDDAEVSESDEGEDDSEEEDEEGDEKEDEEEGEDEEKDGEEEDESEDDDEESSEDDDAPFKSNESGPVEKSFRDLYMERLGRMRGADGKVAKAQESTRSFMDVSAYSLPKDFDDGGGKRITPLMELEQFQKSNRPEVSATVNGDLSRPELSNIAKSGSRVSFKDLLEAPDRHKVMEKDWMEYNLFKSRF